MDDCPSCGGEMQERRARSISITLDGVEGEDAMTTDDGGSDLISWICVDCGYKEEAEYRGEDGNEAPQD